MKVWTEAQWDLFAESIVSLIARKQALAFVHGFLAGMFVTTLLFIY
jgi:hypothetical protein